MAGTRKGPRMIREILRLRSLGLGKKKIAQALGISKNTVKAHWDDQIGVPDVGSSKAQTTTETQPIQRYSAPWAEQVDWEDIKKCTDAGDPLSVVLEEQLEKDGDENPLRNVNYVSFWREFKRRYPHLPLEFHKTHPPGERCEIDFKGARPDFGYWESGRFVQCELFGAILCFSQLFYAEAMRSQKKPEFFKAIHNSFGYFSGVPKILTTDNLKGAVTRANIYDPDLNPEFSDFCTHYGTAPVPARPRRPKDKNLIEGCLGIFWRWIRPRLRKQRFHTITELNAFLKERLDIFNDRKQRKYGLSRRKKFDDTEKVQLLPLPEVPFEICEWRKAKLHWDCHLQVGKSFYSAPYGLRSLELDVRLTQTHVEVFYLLERVAIHPRFPANIYGRYATHGDHLPETHKAILEFIPQKIVQDSKRIGPHTAAMVSRLIFEARHPLLYLRRCQGMIRLVSRYSPAQLEKASEEINRLGETFPTLKTWEGLIKNQTARTAQVLTMTPVIRGPNPNLRGQAHWATSDTINNPLMEEKCNPSI